MVLWVAANTWLNMNEPKVGRSMLPPPPLDLFLFLLCSSFFLDPSPPDLGITDQPA
jgi:hypothetical protein